MKFICSARCGKTLKVQKEVRKRMGRDLLKDCYAYIYDVNREKSADCLKIVNTYYYRMPNIDNCIIIDNITYIVKAITFNYDDNSVYIFVKKKY